MNELYRDERTYWSHVVRHGGNATAVLSLARTYEKDDPERSMALLEEALAQDPNHVHVHINLGILKVRAGEIEEGIALVERAVELSPYRALAQHYLARVYGSQQRVAEAREASLRAADLDRRNGEYQLRAAHSLEKAGDFEAALAYLERVSEHDPLYWRRLFLEGIAYQALGEPRNAEDRFARALELEPGDAWSHYHLGLARMTLGNLPDAIASFERVVEGDEGPIALAHQRLSLCHATLGNAEAAKRHARAAERGGPMDAP